MIAQPMPNWLCYHLTLKLFLIQIMISVRSIKMKHGLDENGGIAQCHASQCPLNYSIFWTVVQMF